MSLYDSLMESLKNLLVMGYILTVISTGVSVYRVVTEYRGKC